MMVVVCGALKGPRGGVSCRRSAVVSCAGLAVPSRGTTKPRAVSAAPRLRTAKLACETLASRGGGAVFPGGSASPSLKTGSCGLGRVSPSRSWLHPSRVWAYHALVQPSHAVVGTNRLGFVQTGPGLAKPGRVRGWVRRRDRWLGSALGGSPAPPEPLARPAGAAGWQRASRGARERCRAREWLTELARASRAKYKRKSATLPVTRRV